jgi:hypothetical protein
MGATGGTKWKNCIDGINAGALKEQKYTAGHILFGDGCDINGE